jgi:hypothetical protein
MIKIPLLLSSLLILSCSTKSNYTKEKINKIQDSIYCDSILIEGKTLIKGALREGGDFSDDYRLKKSIDSLKIEISHKRNFLKKINTTEEK